MSKIDDLKLKYPSISVVSFNKFAEGDPTKTNKYLEYMLKIWEKKDKNNCPNTTLELIQYIHAYDNLLPYIDVKDRDIYHKKFLDVSYLENIILRADELKEEKTFIRDEHCLVLIDNDEYLMLIPKTYKANMKYGASTKWCTVTNKDDSTFNRYTKDGLLVYIISKTITERNYFKYAIYCDYAKNSMTGEIDVWNANDSKVNENDLMKRGWKPKDIMEIMVTYRTHHFSLKRTVDAQNYVANFVHNISRMDIDKLGESMKIIKNEETNNYIEQFKNVIDKIKTKTEEIWN